MKHHCAFGTHHTYLLRDLCATDTQTYLLCFSTTSISHANEIFSLFSTKLSSVFSQLSQKTERARREPRVGYYFKLITQDHAALWSCHK